MRFGCLHAPACVDRRPPTEPKDARENGVVSRSVTPITSRPTTPKPPQGADQFRSGMLTIRIFSGAFQLPYSTLLSSATDTPPRCAGRGLALAPGVQVPEVIQRALEAVAPPAGRRSTSNRESMQRKRYWWLPYVVLEFDKNEILIDAMGGDLGQPVWNYRADLCIVLFACCVVMSLMCCGSAMCRGCRTSRCRRICGRRCQCRGRTIWATTWSWAAST